MYMELHGNPYRDSSGNPTNGATTGCHCHFTLREDGELIDPRTILKQKEGVMIWL